MSNIKEFMLAIKKEQNRLGFMPFFMCGYPSVEESIARMKILLKYADVLEIGIPFSDPLADGEVIQNASKIAIENGFKTRDTFKIIQEANKDFQKPIVILCYFNTVLQYGVENFAKDAQSVGVNALLLPDLPPEEAGDIQKTMQKNNIELVNIISTNTPTERVKYIDNITNSFLYFVSKPSITGANNQPILEETIEKINQFKSFVKNPLYIGFGISSKDQVLQYSKTKADGFIIGSKLIMLDDKNKMIEFLNSICI
jgi:tryptophan synthase alpha chain